MGKSPKGKASKSREESLGGISKQRQGRWGAKVKMANSRGLSSRVGDIVEAQLHESGTQSSKTELRNRIATHVVPRAKSETN